MGVNDFINIGSRIKEVRKKKGIKQKEIANQLGIPISTYANYENNHREPTSEIIDNIAALLDISVESLIGIEIFDFFLNYLESIGYKVNVEKSGESEEGHYEDHVDDEGKIVGNPSWIPDEEHFSINLIKDGITTEFTEEEFKKLQSTVAQSIEFEVFKQKQLNDKKDL